MSKKKIPQILPWNNDELRDLLKEVIRHGTELAKIDFKLEIESSTQEQKAELLKDIVAIANTYDENCEDYGFIVYGAKAKEIVGIEQTEANSDKFQNHVEQLLKTYISPMPQIYVISFTEADGRKWGVIVIPPRNSKPHMFFKDLSCGADRSRSRKKGEWFVRRGTTTDHGIPEDLATINQKQMGLILEPLRESIRVLQLRVAKTEDQYNHALFKLVEKALQASPEARTIQEDKEQIGNDIHEVLGVDLPTRLKQKLRTPKDAITEDLINEAKSIKAYIEGAETGLSWAPQLSNPGENKTIVVNLEEKTRALIVSVATIMLNDGSGVYTDSLLKTIRILAKTYDVPSGVQYNRIGEAIRYYPLWQVVYTAFICGTVAGRVGILKRILEIPLKCEKRKTTSNIMDTFFFLCGAKALFNDAFAQRWCEPIAQRIRQVIADTVGEMISELSEPEYFFRGEFVLALTNIDKCITNGEQEEHCVPLGGLYLYMYEGMDPIADFIVEKPEWFPQLYTHPLNKILELFDSNAAKVVASGCFADGMRGIKTADLFQQSSQQKR